MLQQLTAIILLANLTELWSKLFAIVPNPMAILAGYGIAEKKLLSTALIGR